MKRNVIVWERKHGRRDVKWKTHFAVSFHLTEVFSVVKLLQLEARKPTRLF